mmetsp:Transcript_33965/g.85186  ORF Transcript_33965/g.85186 Transcript_33965/m.85186 type:complete len:715 (+) Transcript_33965:1-2145(+)
MVVDHAFWSKLHACADTFCTWDDYNWDWTIQALQAACPSMGVIHVLQLSSGRVFHAGGCSGVHNSAPACDSGLAVYEQQLEIMKQMEPPASLTLMPGTRQRAAAAPYINGGWGDGRDRQLCKYFAGTGELPRQIVPPNKGGAPLDSKRLGSAPAVSSEEPPAGSGVVQRLVAKASTIIPRLHAASAAARQGAAVPADTPSWTRHEMTSSNKHARKSSIAVEKVQEQPNELGIDPWARSAGAAKESVYRQVNHLLRPDERNEILQLCGRALNHPITTAVALRGLGEDAHVSTGDIPDMWLRDSAFEIAIYMPRMVAKPALRLAVEGTIRRHAFDITMDPYACGFSWKWWDPNVEVDEFNRRQGRGGWVAIRSFEIDSGAYFMNLLWDYYNTDGLYRPDALISETLIHDAVSQMVSTYITEQHHSAQSPYLAFDLPNGGRGKPESYTGMVWSGYRASDDATQYGYNIPDNMYVVGALERMLVLNAQVWKDSHLHERMSKLKAEILDGLQQHATVAVDGVQVYAYEVDGLGNQLIDFDDPNLPSLMSIPLLGYQYYDKQVYATTRERLFAHNKFYVRGSQFEGWASPHTPAGQVWHLGWITQGLTTDSPEERVSMLRNLMKAQCGNNLMHETVNVNNPSRCTRNWFEWANAMLVVFVENSLGESCDAYAQSEFEKVILQREASSRKKLPKAKFYENFEQHIHHADRTDFTKLTAAIV